MGKNILGIFDGSDLEGVSALIDKLEKSSFDYLKLEGDGVKLIIGKNGVGETEVLSTAPAAVTGIVPAAIPAATVVLTEAASETQATSGADIAALPQTNTSIPEQEGVFTIKSPSYGLFYSQSEPGAPPYVTVGAAINKDDTIGLMEIMKTFTAITSPVAGEVVAIHVKNEETLEPDMPLVSIKIR